MRTPITFIVILLNAIIFCSFSYGQNQAWTNYTADGSILSLIEDGDYIWATGWGGIAEINKANGQTTFYNKSNTGILSNHVKDVAIDNLGAKWFAIESYGLAKFDDGIWTMFNTSNSAIPTNDIYKIACDQNGVLWLASCDWSGLISFDGENWTIYNTSNSEIPSNAIFSITVDSFGKKWIGTSSGLAVFDDTVWTIYDYSNSGLPGFNVLDVAIDDNDVKWIGVEQHGLVSFDNENWNTYSASSLGLAVLYFNNITVENNKIWIVTNTTNGGLLKFEDGVWSVFNFTNSALPKYIQNDILVDNQGNKWMGSYGSGVVKFDETYCTLYKASNSDFISNVIPAIDVNKNTNEKWIADYGYQTFGSGLMKTDGVNWTYYPMNDNLPNFPLNSDIHWLKLENDTTIWVGFGTSLGRLQNAEWIFYKTNNSGLPDNYVRSCAVDSLGNKWFGTESGGLVKYNNGIWTTFNMENSEIPDNYITTLAVDSLNVIWAGTRNSGLTRFDGVNWMTFNTENSGLTMDEIYTIEFDKNGVMWIGNSDGLTKFDGTNWTVYNSSNSNNPCSNVITIDFDSENSVWIGGPNTCMAKFDGQFWTSFNIFNSGLPHNYVMSLVFDINHILWIGTDLGGLAVYNPKLDNAEIISNNTKPENNIVIYPNPFITTATVQIINENPSGIFEMFDINGKKIKSIDFSDSQFILDRENIPSGVYIYNIYSSDSKLMDNGKIVIL